MRVRASLRTRLVVIVLLGTVLPLGLVALWQVREVQRFGDRLLRERLEESLQQAIADMGARWVTQRAAVLTLGEYVVGRPATGSANDARPAGRAYVPGNADTSLAASGMAPAICCS
jgi:hypothetical protein